MARTPSDSGEPYRDEPFPGDDISEHPRYSERPLEEVPPAHEGPVPSGSRMMPNDYPSEYPPYQPVRPRRRPPAWVMVLGGCLGAAVLLGAVFACAAGAVVAALVHSTSATATATQTFTVASAPAVRIHDPAGNIRVLPGDAGIVIVRAHKHARGFSGDNAQNALRRITVDVTRSGNALDIQVNEPDSESGIHLLGERYVDLTVTVPSQTNLAVTLNAGNVNVEGITGTMGIRNDAGNLWLDDVTLGGASFATENAGNIDISGTLQSGASLEAQTNAGNVTARLPRATSAHLTASTDAGNLEVDSAWPVTVSRQLARGTASGDLVPNPTGSLVLETNAGNVTLEVR